MLNKNWPKWFQASIRKACETIATANSIALHVEGEDRETDDLSEYVELRVHGPDVLEIARNQYRIDVTVNLLVTVKRSLKNMWRRHEIAGIFMSGLDPDISIYKLGNGPDDDKTKLTCLMLRDSLGESMGLKYRDLGRLQTAADLIQAVVNGTYRIDSLQGA